jgi:hypothetical protein
VLTEDHALTLRVYALNDIETDKWLERERKKQEEEQRIIAQRELKRQQELEREEFERKQAATRMPKEQFDMIMSGNYNKCVICEMYREPFLSCNSSRCAKPKTSFKPGLEYMRQEYKRLSEENARLKEQLSQMQLLQQQEGQAN